MGEILAAREPTGAEGGSAAQAVKSQFSVVDRMAEFGSNLSESGCELWRDLASYGQSVVADAIVCLQSDEWGDPCLSLRTVNALGVVAVIGSCIIVQVINPTVFTSVYGNAYLVSKVMITVNNTFGVLAFAVNQCVHIIYASSTQNQEPTIVRVSMGVFTCATLALPLMNASLSMPLVRWAAYLNMVTLNLCLQGLRQATVRQRKAILATRMLRPGCAGAIHFENACEALTMQGKFSAWMVANQSSASMCSSALLWALWWPITYKPLSL
jgi:hypothetical protein